MAKFLMLVWGLLLLCVSTHSERTSNLTEIEVSRPKRSSNAAEISLKAFSTVLALGSVAFSIKFPIVGIVLDVLKIIFELLVDLLWPKEDLFKQIESLIIQYTRKEIDAAFSKKATQKVMDYYKQFEDFMPYLFSNKTYQKLFHEHSLQTLGDKGLPFNDKIISLVNYSHRLNDSIKNLSDNGRITLIAISIDLGNDKSDFEHAKHPSSTVIQYSRFAILDVMVKVMLSKVNPGHNYMNQAKYSAGVHKNYLLLCIHWMAAESEVEELASVSADQLKRLGGKEWSDQSVYDKQITKLSSDEYLGVNKLAQISGVNDMYSENDYIHNGDIIALRSVVIPKYITSTSKDCTMVLQECNGGHITPFRKNEQSGSFICSSSIFKIFSDRKGRIKVGGNVTLYFQNKKYLDASSFEPLKCGYDSQSQFVIYAKGKTNGQSILDRDAIILKAMHSTGVVSVKRVEHGNRDMVLRSPGPFWHYKDSFRIFKFHSNFDPDYHDPDQLTSSAASFYINFMIVFCNMLFSMN